MNCLAKNDSVRIPKVATAQYLDNEVCLTGIGQWSLRHSRIPPPGYDIRDLFKHRNIKRNSKSSLYFFMNGDEKKEWDSFEKPYALRYATELTLLSSKLIMKTSP